jgi:hypothetical protein
MSRIGCANYVRLDPLFRAAAQFARLSIAKSGRSIAPASCRFVSLLVQEIVAAKPEKCQARNAGDPSKAQGEASVFASETLG